eukprot:13331786-Alexandrium_andersonii.AAC.1
MLSPELERRQRQPIGGKWRSHRLDEACSSGYGSSNDGGDSSMLSAMAMATTISREGGQRGSCRW